VSELVPRNYYNPVTVSRQTRKQLTRIEEKALVRRAAAEAQAQEECLQITAEERNAQHRGHERISGGFDLADHAADRSTDLHHKIKLAAQDEPEQELALRGIKRTADHGAEAVIFHYFTRPS
jgi:hypothetical protein